MAGTRPFLPLLSLFLCGSAGLWADDPLPGTASVTADQGLDVAAPVVKPAPPTPTESGQVWASAEYVAGWVRGASAPPLLTATPVGGGPPTVLFGGENVNNVSRSGFHLRGGLWLDESRTWGVEGGLFFLCNSADRARVGDTPGAIIGRPFFNTQTGGPDIQLVSVPGALSGRAAIDAEGSHFWGVDLACRKSLCSDRCGQLDCLVGYRYLSYEDSLRVVEDLRPLVAPFTPGSQIRVSDEFSAENQFHGLLLAVAGEYQFSFWYVQGRAGASIGRTHRTATTSGQTGFDLPPAAAVVIPGGLLAVSSNSGTFTDKDWAVVPEGAIRVGFRVTNNLRVFAGYSVLYWPSVYRAAEQIDPVVNPGLLPPPLTPLPGPARPQFPGRTSDLWIQSVSIGVEFRY